MSDFARIPVDVIQRITPSQAWEYMLVPCAERDGRLTCYGDEGRDYTGALLELEVLYNISAVIEPASASDLQKLLKQYYRGFGADHPAHVPLGV